MRVHQSEALHSRGSSTQSSFLSRCPCTHGRSPGVSRRPGRQGNGEKGRVASGVPRRRAVLNCHILAATAAPEAPITADLESRSYKKCRARRTAERSLHQRDGATARTSMSCIPVTRSSLPRRQKDKSFLFASPQGVGCVDGRHSAFHKALLATTASSVTRDCESSSGPGDCLYDRDVARLLHPLSN